MADGNKDQLVDELQSIRNIPRRISDFASKVLHATPPEDEPLAPVSKTQEQKDTDAAMQKYMDVAAPKPKPSSTPKPVTPTKKMPVYHTGTDNVPRTGPAMLEKGEAVLDKDIAAEYRKRNDMSKDHIRKAATAALGGKESKPKKEVASLHIKKSANGGHIITHHHTHPEHHPSEDHVTRGDDELAQHVMTHMGEPNDGEAEADAGNAGIPSEAGASAGSAAPAPQAGAPAGAGASIPGM